MDLSFRIAGRCGLPVGGHDESGKRESALFHIRHFDELRGASGFFGGRVAQHHAHLICAGLLHRNMRRIHEALLHDQFVLLLGDLELPRAIDALHLASIGIDGHGDDVE